MAKSAREQLTDLTDITAAYELSEQYLFAEGVNRSNARLQAYRRFLSNLSRRPDEIPDMLAHIRMWREVHELVWVTTVFHQNRIPAPPGLFARALDGLPVEDYEAEHGRNLFLELRAGVYFALAGYQLTLEDDCDVVAVRGRTRIFVECKRIYSTGKAAQRMLEAYRQLERRLAGARGWYKNIGLAWLDPSPAMQRSFFAYSTYSRDGALAAAREDLFVFFRDQLSRKYGGGERRIAGVVLQMVWPSWADASQTKINTGFSTLAFPCNPRITWWGARTLYGLVGDLLRLEEYPKARRAR